jgi:Tol biopolymer transport system component
VIGFLGALQVHRLNKFGMPQAISIAGIFSAFVALMADAQAMAVARCLSPECGKRTKAVRKLLAHNALFACAFVLGLMTEGTTEIVFGNRLALSTPLLLGLLLLITLLLSGILWALFSMVSLALFAVTTRLAAKNQFRAIHTFRFNWAIPVGGAICCILLVVSLIVGVIVVQTGLDSAGLDELFSSQAVLNLFPSTPTPAPPPLAERPPLPSLVAERQLTFGDGSDVLPRWSPDGSRIAFQSGRAGNYDIWVVDAEGGQPELLTVSPLHEMSATWSPDGTRIAFLRYLGSPTEGHSDLYVMSADGGDPVQLTDDGAIRIFVTWTPDGRSLMYNQGQDTVNDAEMTLWALDLETLERRLITDYAVGSFSHNPQGTLLVFDAIHPQLYRRRWLYVMDLEGETVAPIVTDLDRPWFVDWSPDGHWIAFYAGRMGSGGIWLVRPDGTDRIELLSAPEGVRHPSWSPDGSAIVFTKGRGTEAHIWIAELARP